MALKKLMGQNFRIFEKQGSAMVAVAGETTCQVTIQGNTEDESNKDTVSSYAKDSIVSKQWSVQTETNEVTLAALRAYIAAFNSDDLKTVGWDQTAGANNAVAQNADLARSGKAILNDLSLSANNRSTCTLSIQYQGSGALG